MNKFAGIDEHLSKRGGNMYIHGEKLETSTARAPITKNPLVPRHTDTVVLNSLQPYYSKEVVHA